MAEFLLENLKSLLLRDVRPISGAANEIEQMESELRLLKAFLRDSAMRTEERFSEMARQIREVVYDAEDTIDSFLALGAAAKAMDIFRRLLITERRHHQAKKLSSFRKDRLKPMFQKVMATLDERQISPAGSGKSVEKPQTNEKEVPSISLNNVVGFEDEAETLITYLMEETEELDVISITGMPGIGKTTLACKIYQNKKIQEEFPTRMWVDVPQVFHRKDFYLNILKEFTKQEKYDTLSDHDLANKVFEFLESRKFLLVIEDVWTANTWNVIQFVLPKKNKMSKVLITSRDKNVCMYASDTRKPHMLRFLNENESWELLQLQVFGKLDDCPQWLERIGESVAKNCDGLPLAIELIGSSLVVASSTGTEMDLTKHWWNKVSENVTMYVTDYGKHRVSGTLELSYNNLPNRLRDCFLYLGVFPEDYEIPSWTLTRLWIAEGFIKDNEGKSLEETAEEILDYLINSNLVMVDKINPDGKVKTCRVHKVIHGFCKSKAAEWNLFHEIKISKGGDFDPPVSLSPNYLRLCIYSHLSEFLSRKPNGPGVCSFLCFHKENIVLDPKYISAIQRSFNLLRVLESNSIKFTEFSISLTKLMNLRYISVCCDDLDVLPETVSQLLNLQTLVVDTLSPSLVIKANIWRMIQLRHLITKAAIILAIKGKGKAGENLQSLSRLSPECCKERMFERTPNLNRLGIRGQLATLLDAEFLRKLVLLERLKLVNESPNASASNNRLNLLLHPNCLPPNLKRLTLTATNLGWEHMTILGKIDTLQVLKLKNNAFTGQSWNTDADGFRGLEFLFIGTTDLVSWEASADCFRRLRCLVLKNCEKLEKIPLGLAKSLETLDISGVANSAVESAREIKEEKVRMQGRQKDILREFNLSVDLVCE